MATASTSSSTGFVVPDLSITAPIQPLESGDHLPRAEFERRYDAMPELKKAELIEGEVYMPSPVSLRHGDPDSDIAGWLFHYRVQTPGLKSPGNVTIRLDQENEPQPDNVLMIEPAYGGQVGIDADDYIEGAPELVAEIAASSASIDLHKKLRVYRRNGVLEYIVWRVYDRAIDWFVLRDSQYLPLTAGEDGIIRSEVFPGLWLNAPAMLDGKLDVVLATLQQGLATPEHKQFAAELASRRNAATDEQHPTKHD